MAIAEPCCPDSMTKFLLDVFYDTSTSSMFYTTDMMVLIDIVTRQLTDLSQGDEVREREREMVVVSGYNLMCHTYHLKAAESV